MSQPYKIDYHQLNRGFRFPRVSYCLESFLVSDYIATVGERDCLWKTAQLVPPLCIAAGAMAALSQGIAFPPGSVHISQEFSFYGPARAGDRVNCESSVGARQQRGNLCLLNIEMKVFSETGRLILSGKLGFILPETGAGSGS
jgi:acyl dehydratase